MHEKFKNQDQATTTVALDEPLRPPTRNQQKLPPMIVRYKHYNTRKVLVPCVVSILRIYTYVCGEGRVGYVG